MHSFRAKNDSSFRKITLLFVLLFLLGALSRCLLASLLPEECRKGRAALLLMTACIGMDSLFCLSPLGLFVLPLSDFMFGAACAAWLAGFSPDVSCLPLLWPMLLVPLHFALAASGMRAAWRLHLLMRTAHSRAQPRLSGQCFLMLVGFVTVYLLCRELCSM